ncbi:MAG: hypothetical protein J6Y07_04335 [Alphaproteobacteria bacterium]|nr:hypothetical protein [Alphaproteobacteria bacterium]
MDSEKITLKRGEFKFPFVNVESIYDVAKYVSEQTFYKAESRLMDWDKNYFTIQLRKQNNSFYFYVMDKLVYAKDIKKYLYDNYGETFEFYGVSKEMPIAFGGWTKETYQPLSSPKPIISKKYVYNYIRPNYIVVDRNLNQIWPVATGKPPVGLIDLFKKTR